MTLHIYTDVAQRSEAWFDARRGIVTASTVGQLVTPTLKVAANDKSRSLVWQLVAERITGWTDDTYQSHDMLVGTLIEPTARQVYSDTWAPVTECGFMTEDRWGFTIGYSPDGLVGDDGLIEIKSRKAKAHLASILEDAVPAENMAQIQCGLLVSGRAWCDYLSWCGGMPLWRKRVEPDERWFDAIVAAVAGFEDAAKAMLAAYFPAIAGLPMTERISYDMDMVI